MRAWLDWRRGLALLLAALLPAVAFAHKASDSYLKLEEQGEGGRLRWDIALRDLDQALGLDADGDGRLRWGEVRPRLRELEALARSALSLNRGACQLTLATEGLEGRVDGTYLALGGRWRCRGAALGRIEYRLFASQDPTHRGLMTLIRADGSVATAVLDPARAGQPLPAPGEAGVQGFFASGIHHILIGYDHILFLLCLLLPAVLHRTPDGWRPVGGFGEAFRPVAVTVTLFTIAHSITLGLATWGIVRLPASIVEPAIAATIAAAALNNIRPLWGSCNKIFTFSFGLVHGFGFAGVLSEMGLPRAGFARALLHFNLGVEAGQLLVVGIALGGLYAFRNMLAYPRALVPRASMVALGLAAIWFAERAFDLRLLS